MNKICVYVFLMCLMLTGCATTGHLTTPSGRPEIFVEGATMKEVSDACVNLLLLIEGMQIEKTTVYVVHGSFPCKNPVTSFLLGSRAYPQAWQRLTFTFAPLGNGVKVFATQYLVLNKGSGFEKVEENRTQKIYEDSQKGLERIRCMVFENKRVK